MKRDRTPVVRSTSAPPAEPTAAGAANSTACTWSTEQLLGSADEALIIQGRQTYRLRRTTTGKLILTK